MESTQTKKQGGKKYAMDMTEGNIVRLLILFSLPMLLGNLFQELYNTMDSVVLGNFAGKEALAAVGATTFICSSVVRFFNGISIGAGVVISNAFGARDTQRLHKAVQTTMTLSILIGVLVSFITIPYMPLMLKLTRTPEDVFGLANEYLTIYSMGIVFLFVYNMGSSILRAVGDTKRPLYYLIVTSVLNIVLDIVFVVIIPWGVAGTAIATVISEAVSAVMVCYALITSKEEYRLSAKEPRLHPETIRQICIIGLPTAVQQSLTSFGNTFVQGYVNGLNNTAIMAGWSCNIKIDQFALLPMQSVGHAATTFVSQNVGAGKYKRAREGVRKGLWLALILMLGISAVMFLSANSLVNLFNHDAEVVFFGILFVRLASPFRFFCSFNQVLSGALRGAGDSTGPMIIMLFSFVFCRQIYLYVITRFVYNAYVVGFGFPLGWILCGTFILIYYHTQEKKRLPDRDEIPAQ